MGIQVESIRRNPLRNRSRSQEPILFLLPLLDAYSHGTMHRLKKELAVCKREILVFTSKHLAYLVSDVLAISRDYLPEKMSEHRTKIWYTFIFHITLVAIVLTYEILGDLKDM